MAALTRDAESKERPVMKVVRILQDMQVELQKELEDDNRVHAQLACWCKTNGAEKETAIANGNELVAKIDGEYKTNFAEMQELQETLGSDRTSLEGNENSESSEVALRQKEAKEAAAHDADLVEAITSCKAAIVVLKEHHALGLDQLKTMAHLLQKARVTELVQRSPTITGEKLSLLKSMLQLAQGRPASSTSFLSVTDTPFATGYASQSGEILGVLEALLEQLQNDLSKSQKDEAAAQASFEELKAIRDSQQAETKKKNTENEIRLAQLREMNVQLEEEKKAAQDQLAADTEFLQSLRTRCSETDAEFERRLADRQAELKAVIDAIAILNSDTAFDTFDKTVSTDFLQVSSVAGEQAVRQRALSVVRGAMIGGATSSLALVALSLQSNDVFATVVVEIDRLVEELGKQQKDEVDHRDACIKQLHENDLAKNKADEKVATLQAKNEELQKAIASGKEEISQLEASIAETQKQLKAATDLRAEQNADFKETQAGHLVAQNILIKAIQRLKEVYAPELLQQPGAPHIQTSGNHTHEGNGPVRFSKYEQNAGGERVVRLLENILADSRATLDDAAKTEQSYEAGFNELVRDSNDSMGKMKGSIAVLNSQVTQDTVHLESNKATLGDLNVELESIAATNADLHNGCDYIMNNFDLRQSNRAAEIHALGEAKAILRGMN
jgi:hypothetical protein